MNKSDAKAFVDNFYKKIAARWNERVTQGPFMKNLLAGTLPRFFVAKSSSSNLWRKGQAPTLIHQAK